MHFPAMDGREFTAVTLSGVIAVLGLVQLSRAASAGAGPLAWIIGLALLVAGAGRIFLWWRQRGR